MVTSGTTISCLSSLVSPTLSCCVECKMVNDSLVFPHTAPTEIHKQEKRFSPSALECQGRTDWCRHPPHIVPKQSGETQAMTPSEGQGCGNCGWQAYVDTGFGRSPPKGVPDNTNQKQSTACARPACPRLQRLLWFALLLLLHIYTLSTAILAVFPGSSQWPDNFSVAIF